MTTKKAKEKPTFTEAEKAGTTEEEMKILEAEPEPTEEGEKGESEGSETKPKEEGKPKEPPEEKPEEGKPGEKPKEEGEPKEGDTVKIVVDGEEIEGIVSKSGHYLIPYSELEKRSQKLRKVKEQIEGAISKDGKTIMPYSEILNRDAQIGSLRADNEGLRSELHEVIGQVKALKRVPPEEKKPEEKLPEEPDFEALEAKLYDQVDDVKGFLKGIWQEGQKVAKPSEEKPEEKPEVKQETPEQIATRVENTMALKQGVKAILKEYPKLDEENEGHDGNAEYLFTQLGLKILGEKLKDMSEEEQVAWTGNVENLLATTKEAATRTMGILGGSTGDFDAEKEREKIRTEEHGKAMGILKRFNVSEEDVKTLGDVRDGSGDTGIGRFSHLDGLGGEELEEALTKMTPEERQRYANQPPTE